MAKVTIYHNPNCSKSNCALKLLQQHGIEPNVVEYLKTPPNRSTLRALIDRLGLKPHELIREKEHRSLGLPKTNRPEECLDQMTTHPEIIQRPIVISGKHARLGRPPEKVLELL